MEQIITISESYGDKLKSINPIRTVGEARNPHAVFFLAVDIYLFDIKEQILGFITNLRPKLLAQTQDEFVRNCIFLVKFL